MPEKLEKLKALLHELEAELGQLSEVDHETAGLLSNAAKDIDDAIHKQDTSVLSDRGVADQLRQRLEEFEASHPTLTAIASRVTDALGQLGI